MSPVLAQSVGGQGVEFTSAFTALKKELRRMLVPDLHGAALS
jgi:hypothetical protein